jgi:hypothetical protein
LARCHATGWAAATALALRTNGERRDRRVQR